MTILEAENHNLRQRIRGLERALREAQETHMRALKENAQLKDRIAILERQLKPGADGRADERIEATFRVDGVNSRGDAAMGLARNISVSGAFIETDLNVVPGELITVTFEMLGRPFRLQAEVIRMTEAGLGVRFYIDPQQQASLRDVITRL